MKTPFLAICLCLCLAVQAQTCKYTVDKIDQLTGKRTIAMQMKLNYWFNLNFVRVADDYYIESIVYMPGEQNFLVATGTSINLKLGNDQILTAEAVSDAAPTSYVSGTQIYSVYLISYRLTPDQAKAIASHGIRYSKTLLQGVRFYEYSFKDKELEKSQRDASCVYTGAAPAAKAPASTTTTTAKTAKEKEDDSLIESMMRKKQEKKAKEEAAGKAKSGPAPTPAAQPAPPVSTPAPAASTPPPAPKPATTSAPPASNGQAPVTATPLSGADELMKWKKLLDQGIITKEEFEVQKKKILAQ